MKYCLMEIKKLTQEKLFLLFLMLCLCFNAGLCLGTGNVRAAVHQTAMLETPASGDKIYDTLDTNVIGSYYYNERYINASVLNRWIKAKYQKLQASVDRLDAQDADLSPYAGALTPYVHEALFTHQLKALLLEGVTIISLLGLRSFSMERQMETASLVYCSRRGRRIAGDKIIANGIVSALYCLLLIVGSLTIFFMNWDFRSLWDTNIASSFNYVIDSSDPIFMKPFITWDSFTVGQYFVCSAALMSGVLVAWWLLANLVAVLVRSVYRGGIVLASMLCLPFFGLVLLPKFYLSRLFYADTLTLFCVIYCNQWWFTDLGYYSLFAYQEVWTVVVHILVLTACLGAGFQYFRRKDLV